MKLLDHTVRIVGCALVTIGYWLVTLGDLIAEARLKRKLGPNYEGRLSE